MNSETILQKIFQQKFKTIPGFEIRYTHIYHEFDHGLQTDPNHTPFDPYYVLVYIEYDSDQIKQLSLE